MPLLVVQRNRSMKKIMIGILLFTLLGILCGCTEGKNNNDSESGTIEQLREYTDICSFWAIYPDDGF